MNIIEKQHIGVIGGTGTMGKAWIQVLKQQRDTYVISCGREMRASEADEVTTDIQRTLNRSDIVILAVKPQVFREMEHIPYKGLIVSLMAGITLTQLRTKLGSQRLIRTMPNLAVTVGEGITGWMADEGATSQDRLWLREIMQQMGQGLELQEEEQFHAVTALTGSGPGLFAQIAAWFAQESRLEGAEDLVWQVLRGMVHLHEATGMPFDELRDRVRSPNGTTHHGLMALEARKTRESISACLAAARQRSMELGQ